MDQIWYSQTLDEMFNDEDIIVHGMMYVYNINLSIVLDCPFT